MGLTDDALPHKTLILAAIRKRIEEGRDTTLQALRATKDSMESDSKSSMGDKYETSRAMAHIESENLSSQLKTHEEQLAVLSKLENVPRSSEVEFGSLVSTKLGHYFLCVGLGEVDVEGRKVFAISPSSPIGQAMLGKSIGDNVQFRDQSFRIQDIS